MLSETAPLGARNPKVRQLRRLTRRRSSRLEAGLFVIDGPVLVTEALDVGTDLAGAFVDAHATESVRDLADRLRTAGVPVQVLAPGVLAGATDTVTPQGIAALARRPSGDRAPSIIAAGRGAVLVVVLAGVADPGNAGTLMRSAEAAGATGLWATSGSADLFSPKAVRASAGALFHLHVTDELDPGSAMEDLRAAGVRIFGTAAAGGTPYDRADLRGPGALVLGNEARGLDPAWHAAVDEWLTIPMVGRTESLNVAMAGTLLCFEAARQRRAAATR